MRQWQFEWINTWDEAWGEDFISRWRELMQDSTDGHVFYEPAIVRAWYETYYKLRDIEPRFLIANCGKDYEVFFPLIYDKGRWKDGWQNVLYAAGQFEFDYHDPVANNHLSNDLKKSFWEAFRKETAGLRDRIDMVVISRIRDVWRGENGDLLRPVAKAPFINLVKFKAFEDYLLILPKQLRQEINRQPRRLSKLGFLELKIISNVDRALEILPTLEKIRRKKFPLANKTKDFYRNLVKFGLESGIVHLSVLESDGRAISWHLGFLHKARFYYYIPVFESEMATYSPGKVHLAMLVEEAIKQKLEVFDLMLGAEDYKLKWANGSVDLYEYERKADGIVAGIRHSTRHVLQSVAAIKRRLKAQ